MKVSVYKLEEGGMAVLIQASLGKGKAPVTLHDITLGNIKGRVEPEIVLMRRSKPRQPPLPG